MASSSYLRNNLFTKARSVYPHIQFVFTVLMECYFFDQRKYESKSTLKRPLQTDFMGNRCFVS